MSHISFVLKSNINIVVSVLMLLYYLFIHFDNFGQESFSFDDEQ